MKRVVPAITIGLGLFFAVVSYLSTSHGLTLTLAGVTGIINAHSGVLAKTA